MILPRPPCWTPNAQFDPAVCDAKAGWIAIGHITKLVHHPSGYPLNKDFTEFTFVVDRWIKGGDKLPREIPFRTQWCTNGDVMQTDKGSASGARTGRMCRMQSGSFCTSRRWRT